MAKSTKKQAESAVKEEKPTQCAHTCEQTELIDTMVDAMAVMTESQDRLERIVALIQPGAFQQGHVLHKKIQEANKERLELGKKHFGDFGMVKEKV